MTSAALRWGATIQDVTSRLDSLLQGQGYSEWVVSNPLLGDGWLSVDICGNSATWTLKVDTDSAIQDRLPAVCLVKPALLLAHVSYDQTICIDDGQGLSIDTERLADIYAQVLCDAFLVLEDAAIDATRGHPDLFDEFEGYCEGMPHGVLARTSVEPDSSSRLVHAHVENLGKGRHVCWYLSECAGSPPAEFRTSTLATVTGLYVALDRNVFPPTPSAPLDTCFIKRIVATFGPKEQRLWDNLRAKRWAGTKRLCCMLVSQPRPSGGLSLIGLTFVLRKGELDPNGQVRHLVVRRHTPSYMRERGGASSVLAAKQVAVLGCGSVGSEIADTLASCGIGRLTLVDFDNLEVENVFRHVLGKDATGSKKVESLKGELKRKYPGVEVTPVPALASNWLDTIAAKQVDAVVIAVGSPASERVLGRQIRASGLQCGIVITWLEALGLGGHVVALQGGGEGCLDCLYRGDEGEESLHPSVSFVAPGQVVSKSLSGCLGTFIPYSALHSRKTALLASEAALELLVGASRPHYKYWVGDDTEAKAQGIQTSDWFRRAATMDSISATRVVFGAPCRHCDQTVKA